MKLNTKQLRQVIKSVIKEGPYRSADRRHIDTALSTLVISVSHAMEDQYDPGDPAFEGIDELMWQEHVAIVTEEMEDDIQRAIDKAYDNLHDR